MARMKAIIVMCLIVFLLIGGCNNKSLIKNEKDQVVVTINNEKVYYKEADLYLNKMKMYFESIGEGKDIWLTEIDGKPATDYAKEKTLENIISSKIALDKANDYNLELKEEDNKKIEQQIKEFMKNDQIKNLDFSEDIIRKIFKENNIASMVYKYFVQEFQVDEDIVSKKLEEDQEYIKVNSVVPNEFLKRYSVKYIFVNTKQKNENGEIVDIAEEEKQNVIIKVEDALGEIKKGKNFDELIVQYSEAKEKQAISIYSHSSELPKKVIEEIVKMQEGDISSVIEAENGYYIINLIKIINATEEEINSFKNDRENFNKNRKQQYEEQQRQEYYKKKIEEWKTEYNININQSLWNQLQINVDKDLK